MHNRPLVCITLGYMIGIILGLYFKISMALLFIIFICGFINISHEKYKLNIVRIIALISLGALVSCIYINYCERQYNTRYANISKLKRRGNSSFNSKNRWLL